MYGSDKCSFCGKFASHVAQLHEGNAGYSICDECLTKAERKLARKITTGTACSFCGKSSDKVDIMISGGKSHLCRDCMGNFIRESSDLLSGNIHTHTNSNAPDPKDELMNLVREFARHYYKFNSEFNSGSVDWNSFSEMEKLLHPMRGKAGRIGHEEIADIVWQTEQLFGEIHFDDVEGNAPVVKKIAETVDKLVIETKKATQN